LIAGYGTLGRSGYFIRAILTFRNEIIILQKLTVNHKIYAEETKIADIRTLYLIIVGLNNSQMLEE